ncbi:50S ribosomal protein L32 [Patescibacteria group bacterium]|nr:50S ribosomal protein L32 [Patescibacteria group bacterium]MBU4016312.1 50S ribosomal protein L32 [Patescibacteria group bacterium]MBU4098325.1 50S ribosomal protein L32 [Patescibacteria group bacterium]
MPHEPKKRHSRQRQGKRRASIKLIPTQTTNCSNCGKKHFSHTICQHCGYYKGQSVLTAKTPGKPK